MALLLAVSTALLFTAGPHLPFELEQGFGDELCHPGHLHVPVVSRVQESLDRSARRDDPDSADSRICTVGDPVVVHAFGVWPLPAPATLPRTRPAGGWLARGPPVVG